MLKTTAKIYNKLRFKSKFGWKICRTKDDDLVLVKLRIPSDSYIVKTYNDKNRCDEAIVEKMYELETSKEFSNLKKSVIIRKYTKLEIGEEVNRIAYSPISTDTLEYEIGETVEVDKICKDPFEECAEGINYFSSKDDLKEYWLNDVVSEKRVNPTRWLDYKSTNNIRINQVSNLKYGFKNRDTIKKNRNRGFKNSSSSDNYI
jgi:hypothetical protein